MSDLRVPILLVENEEYLMANNDEDRDDRGVPYSKSPEGYWRRKQAPDKNRVCGDADAPLAGPDRNAEAENFSYGQKGYGQGKSGGKSSTIWDDEAWKDKD